MLIPRRWVMSHGLRTLIIVIPTSLIIWVLLSSTISSSALDTTPSTLLHPPTKSRFGSKASKKKNLFIGQLLDHDLNPNFNGTALSEVCASKIWHKGLIFSCDPAEGGIGNIRNIFLNCVRYSIEAGATQLILPSLIPLQKSARIKPEPVSLAYLFDLDHFKNNLQQSCPQIQFLNDLNTLWDKPSTSPPISLFPESLDTFVTSSEKHRYHQVAFLNSPAKWSASFATHLRKVHPVPFSSAAPILVSLQPPLLLQWPLTYDTASFVSNFGLLLKFKPEIRYMAASILYALDQAHSLRYDPLYDATKVQPRLFYGAHLRTGPDAISAGWTPYHVQAQNYLSDAAKTELSIIYLSSDDREDTMSFAQEAKMKGVEVTNSLQALSVLALNGEMKAEHNILARMDSTFKNCVDWIVLSRASAFGGTWESSFGWGVAMTRHRSVENPRWGLQPEIMPIPGPKSPEMAPASPIARRAQDEPMREVENAAKSVKDIKKTPNADAKADTKMANQDDGADLIEASAKADIKNLAKILDGEDDVDDEDEDDDTKGNLKSSKLASAKQHGSSKAQTTDASVDSSEKSSTTPTKSAAQDLDAKIPSTEAIPKPKSKPSLDDEDDGEADKINPIKSKPSPDHLTKPSSNSVTTSPKPPNNKEEVSTKSTPAQISKGKILDDDDDDVEEVEKSQKQPLAPPPKKPQTNTPKNTATTSTSASPKSQKQKPNPDEELTIIDLSTDDDNEDEDEDGDGDKKPSPPKKGQEVDKSKEKDKEKEKNTATLATAAVAGAKGGNGDGNGNGNEVGKVIGKIDGNGKPKEKRPAFEDGLSTIFGPEGEGEMFWGAMWP